jgi:Domain of unknown function (DUF932)
MMAEQGFHPVMAKQSRTRIEGKAPFTKHLLRLRHRDHLGTTLQDEVPELILVNSHDRSSAYKLFAGVMRIVCENGLIIASEDYGSFSLRRSGSKQLGQQIIETTGEVISITAKAFESVNQWKGISLTPPQQLALAAAASELKRTPASNRRSSSNPADRLTTPIRAGIAISGGQPMFCRNHSSGEGSREPPPPAGR